MDILISLKPKKDFIGYIGDGDFNVEKKGSDSMKIISNEKR